MTSAELEELLYEVTGIAVVIIRQSGGDRTKIDDGLWSELKELCGQVEGEL